MGFRLGCLLAFSVLVFAGCSTAFDPPQCDSPQHADGATGTLGQDVTVVVCMKEVPGAKALSKLMKSVPADVEVLYVSFNPTTSADMLQEIARVDAEYANLKVLTGAPPYSNIGDSRRYVFEEGLVKTKYFLSVENVAFFDEHFLTEIYETAEAVRAEERRQGKPTSVSFVPKMLETCDEEPSMWGRRINQSHIMFDPDLYHHKPSDTTYFRAGNVNEMTLLTFADDDGEGAGTARAQEWAETLPDRFEETGVPGARYVHFVEDHVYLAETAFYMDHLDYVAHSDSMWKDDHFYLAAVPMFFNRGVVLVNSVAQMHWFCDWTLEELIFGVSPAHQNCWAWMKHYKTVLFRNIFVPKLQEDFPAFRPDADLSSLRHANLIMAAFLFTSHNEFRFFAREDSTEWIESTDALSELDDMLRQPENNHIGERYVSIRQRYVDVFSEEYKAKGFIPSMPGTYQRHLSTFDLPDKVHKTLEGGIVLDFPAHRLYHTGPIAKSDVSASFLANLIDYSIAVIEHTDIHKFEFLVWADCTTCPDSYGALKRVEPTDQIRIPAFDGDASVRVISFSFGVMRI